MQGFGKKIRDHINSWTVLYFEFSFLDAISYEKIPNVEMFIGLELDAIPLFSSRISDWLA